MKQIAVKERPIIFSSEMVKAILDGRKTMTRRIVKGQSATSDQFSSAYQQGIKPESKPIHCEGNIWAWFYPKESHHGGMEFYCPYGQVGDKLWCKESHYLFGHWVQRGITNTGKLRWEFRNEVKGEVLYEDCKPIEIKTGKTERGWFKRPSMFMYHWASRITLEITGIRVEKLQDITEEDAYAEGAWPFVKTLSWEKLIPEMQEAVRDIYFRTLWDSINSKKYPWVNNDWVWVLEFRRMKP
jgi:hypothetical protein